MMTETHFIIGTLLQGLLVRIIRRPRIELQIAATGMKLKRSQAESSLMEQTFLVWWKDGTKSREPASNITDHAKEVYFVNLRNKNRRRQ